MSFRNVNSKQSKKPFCKVCQDAGKSESEYTSHYVRSLPDKSGKTKVICPTLLATECRYCYELGHTTKFCPVIEANKKAEKRAFSQAEHRQAVEKKPAPKKAPSSGFAALADDSDSEEENITKVSEPIIEQFPVLGAPVKQEEEAKPVMSGWAAVAAKTQAEYQTEKYEQELIAKSIKRQLPPSIKKPVVIPQVKKSWADWSDSEEEDEEEEEVAYEPPKKLSVFEMDWAAVEPESDEDW
jgi:hypothetical protein